MRSGKKFKDKRDSYFEERREARFNKMLNYANDGIVKKSSLPD